jgi:hypothetical protein
VRATDLQAFFVAVPYIWHSGRGRYHTALDDVHYRVLFEACDAPEGNPWGR